MKDTPPVYKISVQDDYLNRMALVNVVEDAPQPTRIVDMFGGLGKFCFELIRRFPGVPIVQYEIDDRCVEYLRVFDRPGVTVIQGDALKLFKPQLGDGVVADFNLLTLKRAQNEFREFFFDCFKAQIKWLIVTDSAPSKLHLNYRNYGCKSPSIDEYIYEWSKWVKEWGYRIARFTRAHFRSTLLLIER
jgi:hypothetical protein